jgi:hypothetical protein
MSLSTPDDSTISDEEVIWRRVHEKEVTPDDNLNKKRPSSATFLQKDQLTDLSVYIASEASSIDAVMQEGNQKYLVSLSAKFIRSLDLGIIRDKATGGPGHAAITGNKTHKKRSAMAKNAEWVPPFQPT